MTPATARTNFSRFLFRLVRDSVCKYRGLQAEDLDISPLYYMPFPKFSHPNNYNGSSCNEKFREYKRFSKHICFQGKTKVMFNKAYRKEYQIHRNRVENTSPNLVLPLFTSKHLLLLLFQHFRFHR